ncbi:type I 3-dehydroquinate dehydratase [Shouchella shacheensis]|uniref:type I 3-dehydroquinate dehydratase n=1 Tax=Shouchella shacheensis TaxID=1649580 RepID=UPI0015D65CC5|nr:type I 3-dehydroquinate dehydratase [Shouchella shacheensis]
MNEHEVTIRGVRFHREEHAKICSILVGETAEELLKEAKAIVSKEPDVLEWRADFFQDLSETDKVMEIAKQLRSAVGNIPLLFTIRSEEEGGESRKVTFEEEQQLCQTLIQSQLVDLMDVELSKGKEAVKEIREKADQFGCKVVVSRHYFTNTPTNEEMTKVLHDAHECGAHIAKLAVMAKEPGDVLRLLDVTHKESQQLPIPMITMSMGRLGASSRLIGDQFGSVMTFAIGQKASASGQVPIDVVRNVQEYT